MVKLRRRIYWPFRPVKNPGEGRGSEYSATVLFSCSFGHHSLFTDPGALTAAAALVEQFRAANMTGLIQYDRINIGRIKRKNPFHTHAIGDLANGKTGRLAVTLLLDHISFKGLDPFLVTLYDLVIHCDIITGLKSGKFFFTGQLLVYVCNGVRVHDLKFRTAKVRDFD